MTDKESVDELLTLEQWWEAVGQSPTLSYSPRTYKDEILRVKRERFYEPAVKAQEVLRGVVVDGLNLQLMRAGDFGFCVVITTKKGVVVIRTWADASGEEGGLSINGVQVENA